MKGKGISRLIEWGKTILILLLAVSAVYLLGRTQFSDDVLGEVKLILNQTSVGKTENLPEQSAQPAIYPMRLTVNMGNGQRFGVQYDTAGVDAAYASMSTLLSEALGSAGAPARISERAWQTKLAGTGFYVDFYYPLSITVLSGQLGEGNSNTALFGTARRLCLAADQDDRVSLCYFNEEDGWFYSCETTLSRTIHLEPVLAERSPNGAMFAFEVPGMERVASYTLLTTTPRPAVCRVENPLLADTGRVRDVLQALSFQFRGSNLDPVSGGLLVEENDSLRLLESGVMTFHTIGDSDYRFLLSENTVSSAVDYVQELAQKTVGTLCGDAELCLAGVEDTGNGLQIVFRYCLNGLPVASSEGFEAARFVVRDGAVTDFSLYFRMYTITEETTAVLPELQAAAILSDSNHRENELTLLYQDLGRETVSAGWVAN